MKTTRRILASLVAASFASVLAPAASYAADQVKIDGGILEGIMGTDPRVRLFISYST